VTGSGVPPGDGLPGPGEAVSGSEASPPGAVRGPIDASRTPRFAGPPTFALLPRRDEVGHCDVAVAGVPFDSGTSYRPGARFGPSAVRAGSRLLRPWHPGLDVSPLAGQQVADAGDIACNPFDIKEAVDQIEAAAAALLGGADHLLAIGGDHTIAYPLLRATRQRFGPPALIHFDAHLDTWQTYFGAPLTHGTPFRRAAEEGLFAQQHSMHVGIRGPLYAKRDLDEDAELGFRIVSAMDVERTGIDTVAERIRERVGDVPVYISIDIDVLDPAHAPGTGTPEAGGLTSRELLGILRGLAGCHLVGADVVEVSPAYDHAELTSIAAAHVCYDLLALMLLGRR
jgi:agmatinase